MQCCIFIGISLFNELYLNNMQKYLQVHYFCGLHDVTGCTASILTNTSPRFFILGGFDFGSLRKAGFVPDSKVSVSTEQQFYQLSDSFGTENFLSHHHYAFCKVIIIFLRPIQLKCHKISQNVGKLCCSILWLRELIGT